MTTELDWAPKECGIGAATVRYRSAGQGPALLYLPHDNGYGPSKDFLASLARDYTVVAPWLPGFHDGGPPEEWAWLKDTGDLALALSAFVRKLGLSGATVLGLGYGGWLAAEMAVARPDAFAKLVLVAPMGLRTEGAAIYDQFLVSSGHYAERAYHDPARFVQAYGEETPFEQLEAWETDREMLCRIAWKPYLYSPALEQLLAGLDVPAVIAHGDDDRIVPRGISERYAAAIPGAKLVDLPGCGHAAEFEQPDALRALLAQAG
ncbi:MAG: alpha/beta hydrolase [Dehalococcoidia bacterium]|nr:alpha/beta hydrolase [Dehalococcoidia bacterium]